jgi:CRISPR/Cas system endoribonuclease Cas6 (RAMP superfamily)
MEDIYVQRSTKKKKSSTFFYLFRLRDTMHRTKRSIEERKKQSATLVSPLFNNCVTLLIESIDEKDDADGYKIHFFVKSIKVKWYE